MKINIQRSGKLRRMRWVIVTPLVLGVIFLLMSSNSSFFQNDYQSELIKAYNTLGQYGFFGQQGSYYTLNELTTDEMVVPARGSDWYDGGIYLRLHKHQYSPNVSDGHINVAWQNLYTGVVACNKQLYQYSKITTGGINIYKAELRVLRAYYYYLLLDAFRNVPIIVDYFPISPGLPASNTSTQLYNFIESEINASLPDLSATPIYGRFNQSGARAILAKLYLNANVYIGQTKWTEAVTVCDDIINSGYYNLTPDYFTSFYPNNDTSTEIIFQVPYGTNGLGGFQIHYMTLHYESQKTFNLSSGQPWNGYSATQDFYNTFEAGDSRRGQFLTGVQRDTTNHVPLVEPIFDGDPDGTVINFTPAINNIANAYRQSGARIHKWKYQIGAGSGLINDFAIFRYADVLLMKAEAQLRLGSTASALTLVNQIRTRAGISSLGTLTLPDVLAERGREFFAETWRRQDLIRFGAYNSAWWEKPASPAHVNIFPIPAAQLTANPNLTQNPGY